MIDFLNKNDSIAENLDYLSRMLIYEIKDENVDVDCFDWDDLVTVLGDVLLKLRSGSFLLLMNGTAFSE
jgi:hypothetical protein